MQLDKNKESVETKLFSFYSDLRTFLEGQAVQRNDLKRKVNDDTKLTSSFIKQMEFKKTQSVDNLRKAELNVELAVDHIESFKDKMKKSNVRESARLGSIHNKKHILNKLVYQEKMPADPRL